MGLLCEIQDREKEGSLPGYVCSKTFRDYSPRNPRKIYFTLSKIREPKLPPWFSVQSRFNEFIFLFLSLSLLPPG